MSQLQSLPLGQLLEKWKQITNCNDLRLTGDEEKMIEYVRNNELAVACFEHPNCSLTNSPEAREIIPLNLMKEHMLRQEFINRWRISTKLVNVHWMPVWRDILLPRYILFYINVYSNRKIKFDLLCMIGCGANDCERMQLFNFDLPSSTDENDEESLSNIFNKLSVEDEMSDQYDSSDSMS